MHSPTNWHPRMLIDGAPTADNSSTNVSALAPAYPSFGSSVDLPSAQIRYHDGGWIIATAAGVTYTAIWISAIFWIYGHRRVLQAWKGIGLTLICRPPWRRATTAPATDLSPLHGTASGALLLPQSSQALSITDGGATDIVGAAGESISRDAVTASGNVPMAGARLPHERLSQADSGDDQDTLGEPLVKYNTADWAVPSHLDLDDDSLFVEPIAPITVPPKYKSSDYCTYKPPPL